MSGWRLATVAAVMASYRYCVNCAGEFQAWVRTCPDCDVALQADLPPPPPAEPEPDRPDRLTDRREPIGVDITELTSRQRDRLAVLLGHAGVPIDLRSHSMHYPAWARHEVEETLQTIIAGRDRRTGRHRVANGSGVRSDRRVRTVAPPGYANERWREDDARAVDDPNGVGDAAAAPVTSPDPTTPERPGRPYPAGAVRRLTARLLDDLLIGALSVLGAGVLVGTVAVWWTAFVVVLALSEALTGRTPGKALLGMRTHTASGSNPSPLAALLRNAWQGAALLPGGGWIVSSYWLVAGVSIASDRLRRAPHDVVAGTRVGTRRPPIPRRAIDQHRRGS